MSGEDLPVPARLEVPARRGFALAWGLAACGLALPGLALVLAAAVTVPGPGALLLIAAGLLPVLVFGYPAFAQLREAFAPGPRIVIDEEGLEDRAMGIGKIPWRDIEYVERGPIPQHLFLMLRDPEGYMARTPRMLRAVVRMNLKFGYPPFLMNLIGTDLDPLEVVATIQARVARHGARALPEGAAKDPGKLADTGGVEDVQTTDEWMGRE